jgi:hypothetical protein
MKGNEKVADREWLYTSPQHFDSFTFFDKHEADGCKLLNLPPLSEWKYVAKFQIYIIYKYATGVFAYVIRLNVHSWQVETHHSKN